MWYHFKIYGKTKRSNNKDYIVQGFTKLFRHVSALRLSLHGYIIIVGDPADQINNSKYLVYNLSGDCLLRDYLERSSIKGVFLNNTEDQLIIAQNLVN